MLSEQEFIENALKFLAEIGADVSEIQPETNLFESGVLDSLGTLAFLDFLDQERGQEIEIENLEFESISTLRRTYQFVVGEE